MAGAGRAMVEKLRAAGITGPADVTAGRLELVEGIGPKRAARLAASFGRARPAYDTAELLIQCRVPVRFAGSAVALLGPSAARQLRDDPWKLLLLPQIRPDQADWFARQLLEGQANRQDPRRGRALVVHLLVKASRDGHTAVPADAVVTALGAFGIDDPGSAVVAAIDDGAVLPFEAFGAGLEPADPDADGPGDVGGPEFGAAEATAAADIGAAGAGAGGMGAGDGDEDDPLGTGPGTLLALTQYAIAEESVAEGLQRLAATAEPVASASGDSASGDMPPVTVPPVTAPPVTAPPVTAPPVMRAGPATPSSTTASARPWRRSPTMACPC